LFDSRNGYPIIRCDACGVKFTDDRNAPPPNQLYPAFDQSDSVRNNAIRRTLGLFLRQRAGFVRSLKPSGRLLDYGCGNGSFAAWISCFGFEAVGLEPFSLSRTVTRERLTLIQAPLASVEDKLGEFDVITLWHVLEHLAEPVAVLQQLARRLRTDGVLVVSVPNFRSWQRTLFGGGWFHLDPPRHLLHFEPETLRDCLRRAGLEPVAERRFLPEYGTSGWVQSALNAVLPHKNYLYELAKDRGALKGISTGSAVTHLALSLVLGLPILAASFPLELASTLQNAGAALTVAARRAPV
jgi:SAM-dependent methyltransferase